MNIENVTKENYHVEPSEQHLYHVKIELMQYNPKTGAKISRPHIKKFGMKIWTNNLRSNLRKQGYTIEVLHNPVEWAKEEMEKAAEAQKMREEEMAKTIEEQRAAEKEAMKQEILKELEAAGILGGVKEKTEEQEEKPKRGRPKKEESETEVE